MQPNQQPGGWPPPPPARPYAPAYGPPPPAPWAPPPPPPKRRGRTGLVVALVLVLLVCLGAPGAVALVYVLENNGPHQSIGLACAVVTGPESKPYRADLPGEPSTGVWTTGCRWTKSGDFMFTVQVVIKHKHGFKDSIDEAKSWYEYLKGRTFDESTEAMYDGEDTWGIGDEAYLGYAAASPENRSRFDKSTLVARTGNAVIFIEYMKVRPGAKPAGGAEVSDALRAFRDPAMAIYKDVTDDLH